MQKTPWWKGPRGEWYVILQLALMALLFFGPRNADGLPEWPLAVGVSRIAGILLVAGGGVMLLTSLLKLGSGLTPLPYPREGAKLVRTGPYGVVRHPMYSGGLLIAFGWALVVQGWVTLLCATTLLVLFDFKSRREERWLTEKFADYPDYQRQVRKLIPWVY